MTDQHRYELELLTFFPEEGQPPNSITKNLNADTFMDGRIVAIPVVSLSSDCRARAAIREGFFAECVVTYRSQEAGCYAFICHIINKLSGEIAMPEMLLLQEVAADIQARYQQFCRPIDDQIPGERQ
jgi:hypothetical protein